MVYLALFGSGYMFLLQYTKGIVFLVFSVICAVALYSNIVRGGWEEGPLVQFSDAWRLARASTTRQATRRKSLDFLPDPSFRF